MLMFKDMPFILLGALLFMSSQAAGPYDGKVLRIVPKTAQELQNLTSLETDYGLEVDFWQEPFKVGQNVDIYVHQNNLTALEQVVKGFGMSFSYLINDVQGAVDKENPATASRDGRFRYYQYNSLSSIYAELRRLASSYPNLATLFSTGKSYEGREQLAIKIQSQKSVSKKLFFINCGIHAREWITPATCMYMINEMLSKYGQDSSVTKMVDKVDWVIMPSLNPDGYEHTWTWRGRMWRRTRTRYSNCIGADPNRNWNYKWGGVGTSSRCGDTYHGPRPFSEVETYNVAKYLFKNRKNLIGYMDIHAYSQLWMTPWGYKRAYPRDNGEQIRVGRIAAAALRNAGWGTTYRVGPSSIIIYSTSGTTGDWAHGFLGVKYSYALELRDTGRYGFLLPANQIIPTGTETFAAMKAMTQAMKLS